MPVYCNEFRFYGISGIGASQQICITAVTMVENICFKEQYFLLITIALIVMNPAQLKRAN